MKASKTALTEKQRKIAEEQEEEEKKAKEKIERQKEKNMEKFREMAELAEQQKASIEDQKAEYERMGPEIMKIMKEVKNIIDVPLFARSEHLKTAIENCKRKPTRSKKVKPYTLEVKESKIKKDRLATSQAKTGLNDEEASFESLPTDEEEGPRESFFESSRPGDDVYIGGISVDECSFESLEVEASKSVSPKSKSSNKNTKNTKNRSEIEVLSKAEEHYKGSKFDVCSFIREATKKKNITLLEEVKRKVDKEIDNMEEKRKRKWVGRLEYDN